MHNLCRQLLLYVRAVAHDRGNRAHIGVDRDAFCDAADPSHFFNDQHSVEETAVRPTILLGNRVADQSGFREVTNIVSRIGFSVRSVSAARLRTHLFRHLPGQALKPLLFGVRLNSIGRHHPVGSAE